MSIQAEKILSTHISKFLRTKYKDVIFRFDTGADMKLTIGQAMRSKSLHGAINRGYPDLFIAEANKYYHGLYLELKADGKSPFKKDGSLKKNDHLQEQQDFINKLKDKGYAAGFAVGLKEALDIIDEYMENR